MFENLCNAGRSILKQFLPTEVGEITDTILDRLQEVYTGLQEKSEEAEERVRLLEENNHSLITENRRLRDRVKELSSDLERATWMKQILVACCYDDEYLQATVQRIVRSDIPSPKASAVRLIHTVKKTGLKEALKYYEKITW